VVVTESQKNLRSPRKKISEILLLKNLYLSSKSWAWISVAKSYRPLANSFVKKVAWPLFFPPKLILK
jgi:hypothetical protein